MYLFLDTETGGLDPKQHSLLTFSCDLVNEIGDEPISSFSAAFKYPVYHIDPAAIRMNNIDISIHDGKADTVADVRMAFRSWLLMNNTSGKSIKAVGWNIAFDLGFIYEQFFPKKEWNALGIDYHSLDVCALVEWLIIKGTLQPARRLVQVAIAFGLDTTKAHDASYDNYLCRKVVEQLIKL